MHEPTPRDPATEAAAEAYHDASDGDQWQHTDELTQQAARERATYVLRQRDAADGDEGIRLEAAARAWLETIRPQASWRDQPPHVRRFARGKATRILNAADNAAGRQQ